MECVQLTECTQHSDAFVLPQLRWWLQHVHLKRSTSTDSSTCSKVTDSRGCLYMKEIPTFLDAGCYPLRTTPAPIDKCSSLSPVACDHAVGCYSTTIAGDYGDPSVAPACFKFTTCEGMGADMMACISNTLTRRCRFQQCMSHCYTAGNALTPAPATLVPTVACESMNASGCTPTDRCYYQSGCTTFITCESLGAS